MKIYQVKCIVLDDGPVTIPVMASTPLAAADMVMDLYNLIIGSHVRVFYGLPLNTLIDRPVDTFVVVLMDGYGYRGGKGLVKLSDYYKMGGRK